MTLTIERVATVVSMTQLEDASTCGEPLAAAALGLARTPEAAVREVGGSALPLYSFPTADGYGGRKHVRSFGDLSDAAVVPDEDIDQSSSSSDSASEGGAGPRAVPQRSVLDMLLLGEWEDRAQAGLFRYDVTACPTKMVPGSYGFVAQLNEGRQSKKRPTEFLVDQVDQPFDPAKFNFTKALQKEVLFQFAPAGGAATAPGKATGAPRVTLLAAPASPSPHLVFINVSPIEYGHVLLVPRALDELRQLVTPAAMRLALQFAREANNPYFRMGFNSLGAYGTINHLHFQGYYLAAPFAIERAPTRPLPPPAGGPRARGGVRVSALAEYPVRAMVFEAGDSLAEMADAIGRACQRLTAANVPHNMFIADCGARVFLYPNCFAERKARGEVPEDVLATQVDPATFEGAGHIVLKRQEDYDTCTQEWAWRLLEMQSLTEEGFTAAVATARADEW